MIVILQEFDGSYKTSPKNLELTDYPLGTIHLIIGSESITVKTSELLTIIESIKEIQQ